MIPSLAIAAGILSVLSDDERPNLDELFQRAVMFENADILYSALSVTQRIELIEKLWPWLKETTRFSDAWEERRKVFNLFYEFDKASSWPWQPSDTFPARKTEVEVFRRAFDGSSPNETHRELDDGESCDFEGGIYQRWDVNLGNCLWSINPNTWADWGPHVYEAIYDAICNGAVKRKGFVLIVKTNPDSLQRYGTVTFSSSQLNKIKVLVEFTSCTTYNDEIKKDVEFSVECSKHGFDLAMEKIDNLEQSINKEEEIP